MGTIAEGVKPQDQAEMLLSLGCQMGQGWLFCRPVPADQLSKITSARRPVELRLASGFWRHISYNSPPSLRLAQPQALYEGAPVGLALLSPELQYIDINPQLAEINAAPLQEHLGEVVSEMFPRLPADRTYLRCALAGRPVNALEGISASVLSGQIQAFLVSYLPVLDEAGEVVGVSVAVIDTTARSR